MQTIKVPHRYFIFFSLMLLIGCSVKTCPVCIKDGKEYGWSGGNFLGQWDDHYQCALSYIKGKCYDKAITSLDEAIKIRNTDKWRARSYGMHFINYFPHREKGLCYFKIGQYEMAKYELELSISQESSAKSKYYLNQTRKKLMKNEPVSIPEINILSSLKRSAGVIALYSKDYPVILSGIVKDKQYVASIHVLEKAVFLESTLTKAVFKEELFLDQGKHPIQIKAKNLLGGEKERTIIINVDRSGPVIIINRIDSDISGFLYDASGIISLTSNGENINLLNHSNASEIKFHIPLKNKAETVITDQITNNPSREITKIRPW